MIYRNCNCGELFQFYIFISEHPSKVRDLSSLRCQSPEDVFGRSWESACYLVFTFINFCMNVIINIYLQTWYPQSKMGTSEKIWTFFMISVVGEMKFKLFLQTFHDKIFNF